MENFPPNSRKAEKTAEPKQVERVTSATARRRKQPLGRKFSRTFFGGDARTASEYMIGHVVVPALKEMLVEAASSGFERLVYGDVRPKGRGRGAPTSGPLGYVSYNSMGQAQRAASPQRPQQAPQLSRRSRARHDFDDLVIPTRQEAEEVIDRMYDLISKYDSASVADLYELTGLKGDHADFKWGWTNLQGASVGRVRGGGYLLDLPEPEFLE
jgi:hypothetical protein